MSLPRSPSAPTLLVVCLCAEWCNVCGEYRSRYEQVQRSIQAQHPNAAFLWVDVEDDADLLHPLDIENFPTLLLAVNEMPRFFGPLTPQAQTLERLINAHLSDTEARPLVDQDLINVVARIRQSKLL